MSGGTDTAIRHHPSEATLVGYAAGSLWEAAKPVVAAHLARCPDCRAKLEPAEAVGGLLLEELPPTPLAPGALRRAMERLDDAPEPDAEQGLGGGQEELLALAGVERQRRQPARADAHGERQHADEQRPLVDLVAGRGRPWQPIAPRAGAASGRRPGRAPPAALRSKRCRGSST